MKDSRSCEKCGGSALMRFFNEWICYDCIRREA